MKRTAKSALAMMLLLCLLLIDGGQQAFAATAPATEKTTAEAKPAAKTEEDKSVPEDWDPELVFTTVDTEGNEWTELCFLDAKLTMMNLWAFWCPPCVGEIPDLQKLYETYADEGFQILGVSMEEYEEDNIKTMEELQVTYPTLRLTESINKKMNTGYIPATIFVDENGKLVGELYVGSRSYDAWEEIILDLLPDAEAQKP